MTKDELLESAKYLAEKYLDQGRGKEAFEVLATSLTSGHMSAGKEFMHILTSEKEVPFSEEDYVVVKDLAYNLGL